jgi:hypothetical protein
VTFVLVAASVISVILGDQLERFAERLQG